MECRNPNAFCTNLVRTTKVSENQTIWLSDKNLCPKAERLCSNVQILDIWDSLYSGMPKSEQKSRLNKSKCPKSKHLEMGDNFVWISALFGYQTLDFGIPLYSERSDFRRLRYRLLCSIRYVRFNFFTKLDRFRYKGGHKNLYI